MIGYLIGKPMFFDDFVIIQTVSGVGYKVFVNHKILAKNQLNNLELFIYSYLKEDRSELYGFESQSDLQLFELLVSVSGCGPKMALAISEAGSEAIINAIRQANVSFFTSFPRVGKKVGQKLIIELKSKLGGKKDLDLAPKSPVYQDTYEALLALGLSAEQVETALATLDLTELTPAAAVKQVLRNLKK